MSQKNGLRIRAHVDLPYAAALFLSPPSFSVFGTMNNITYLYFAREGVDAKKEAKNKDFYKQGIDKHLIHIFEF